MARRYKSESQANAEALYRRTHTYGPENAESFSIAWDWRQREPRDLRDAAELARKAYADEVPTKLHDGPDAIGPDGTPRMAARAEGYIFGDPRSDDAPRDAETGERDPIGYYHAPFRALLAQMECGDAKARRRAAIVRHVTIGSMRAVEAAIAEKAHPVDAHMVAEDALRAFLRQLSDIRLHPPQRDTLEGTVTAA